MPDEHLAPKAAPYEATYATGQRLARVHLGAHHPAEKLLATISARLRIAINIYLINISYFHFK